MADSFEKFKILGSEWFLFYSDPDNFPLLNELEGYTDKSTRTIVVADKESYDSNNMSIKDISVHINEIVRHEVIHAYLIESGIDGCYHYDKYGHDEIMVDWIAMQFPKIYKTFEELKVL